MRMRLQVTFLLFACLYGLSHCKEYIFILGLIPYHEYVVSQSSMQMTELAISEINAREDLLPGYELYIFWKDTQCSSSYSLYHFLNSSLSYYTAIFGLPCLHTTSALAEIVPLFDQLMFTHSAYLPDYRSSASIVNGFPTGLNAVAAQLKFISDHNWKRVAMINYESLYFSKLGYELESGLHELNIANSVRTLTSTLTEIEFEVEIEQIISFIDTEGYRVVVFNMFHEEAESILCKMSDMGINFDKYSLLLPGFIEFEIQNTGSTKCNLYDIVPGAIGFIEHPRVEDILDFGIPTINGDSPSKIIPQHVPSATDTIWDVLGPFMYDSMWSLAFALDEAIKEGHDFHPYPADALRDYVYEKILKQSFRSLTGDVFYHNKLRVSTTAQLVEYTPDGIRFRGLYTNLPYDTSQIDSLTGVTLIKNVSFKYWDEERSDGVEIHYSSLYISVAMAVLSALAVVYLIILISVILFGVCKGYPPAVKSEPAMSIFILASNGLLLAMAVLLTFDGKFYPFKEDSVECTVYCHLLVWLGSVSTSLILGGILAKSLKLYVLNKFKKNYERVLRFCFLIFIPLSLALIDTIIILFWAVFSPIPYVTQVVRSSVKDPPFFRTASCGFSTDVPLFVLISIKVVIIIVSIFLAFLLRKVTNKSQRYTFVISLVVFNILFFCLFIVFIIGYVSDLDSKIALASSFCVLSAISMATMIGLPIIYYMCRDPHGNKLFIPNDCAPLPANTDLLHERIKTLENDIEQMRLQQFEQLADQQVEGKNPKKKISNIIENKGANWVALRNVVPLY